MKHKTLKQACLLVICMVLMVSFFVPPITVNASAEDDLKDLNDQYIQLKKEQDAINKQISNATSEKAKQLAIKKNLESQIYLTQKEIDLLLSKITLLETAIAEKEQEILELEASIAENYSAYKDRLRIMYKTGNTSSIGVVLGAESFSEFLMRAEVLKRVASHDQEILDDLEANKARLEETKLGLDADKADLADSKALVEKKKKELGVSHSQTVSAIQDISALEKELAADKAAYQRKMNAVQAEISQIYKEIGSMGGDYIGGDLQWPVPGYSNISSEYGSRFGGSDFHTGFDISTGRNSSNISGKSIVAANGGTVTYVRSYDAGGYGKYLIVDHGGGITTLYAHCSSIDASVGQRVERGDNIANVGNTGWSTGPHLHFEVRVNGVHKNPRGYF